MFKISFVIIILALLTGAVYFTRLEKQVTGVVLDCQNDQPIADATIRTENLGWGVDDGKLVWHKNHVGMTTSDENGNFVLKYRVGSSAHLLVEKLGYATAEQWEINGDGKTVKLIFNSQTNPNKILEVTHFCRPISECLETTEIDGVIEARDVCKSYE